MKQNRIYLEDPEKRKFELCQQFYRSEVTRSKEIF